MRRRRARRQGSNQSGLHDSHFNCDKGCLSACYQPGNHSHRTKNKGCNNTRSKRFENQPGLQHHSHRTCNIHKHLHVQHGAGTTRTAWGAGTTRTSRRGWGRYDSDSMGGRMIRSAPPLYNPVRLWIHIDDSGCTSEQYLVCRGRRREPEQCPGPQWAHLGEPRVDQPVLRDQKVEVDSESFCDSRWLVVLLARVHTSRWPPRWQCLIQCMYVCMYIMRIICIYTIYLYIICNLCMYVHNHNANSSTSSLCMYVHVLDRYICVCKKHTCLQKAHCLPQ